MLMFILIMYVQSFIFNDSSVFYCVGNDLVIWGQFLASNVGYPRFSAIVASIITLPLLIKGLVVGLILGDAHMRITKGGALKECFTYI